MQDRGWYERLPVVPRFAGVAPFVGERARLRLKLDLHDIYYRGKKCVLRDHRRGAT
jgi:hypothetical protein